MDDLPGDHDPTSRYGGYNDTTTDIDVLWEERHHIVGARDLSESVWVGLERVT